MMTMIIINGVYNNEYRVKQINCLYFYFTFTGESIGKEINIPFSVQSFDLTFNRHSIHNDDISSKPFDLTCNGHFSVDHTPTISNSTWR